MSLSAVVIANVVLDMAALGALWLVCRVPFRLGVVRAHAQTSLQQPWREREQQAA